MAYQATILRLRKAINTTFNDINTFFALSEAEVVYRPDKETWSIAQILEHISLTSHFLMITLKQSRDKVLRRAKTQAIPEGESRLDRIMLISDPDAFAWVHPTHMTPSDTVDLSIIRATIQEQKATCLQILEDISNGEGALHRVRMSVQELGKLDMYEWLFFLIEHAKRHITEMRRLQTIYKSQ
ncbi:MAG: DinB family protein [Chloroflexota bacterium]